jgi:Tol biopolymer transport system component
MKHLTPCARDPLAASRGTLRPVVALTIALALTSLVQGTAPTGDGEAKDNGKPGGRIFAAVTLRTRPPGAGQEETLEAVIAIDPETGTWAKLVEKGLRPRVSPDGKALAYTKDRETWVCDTQGTGKPARVSRTGGAPCWSPDGKRLLIGSGEYDEKAGWKFQSWTINPDGSKRVKEPVEATDAVDDWSPDGKWFLTGSDRHPPHGSNYQLYLIRTDGKEQRRLTEGGLNCYARFSPDGRSVAYQRADADGRSIRVLSIDGKNAHVVLSEKDLTTVDSACWSPDGKRLAVVVFDWQQKEKGEKFIADPERANYRLVIVGVDGKDRRELKLAGVTKLVEIHHCPDWR